MVGSIWLVQLVFDCADPDAVPRFWGQALEYRNRLAHASDAEVAAFRAANPQFAGRGRVDDRQLRRPPVYVQQVPEPKEGPNRLWLEVGVAPGTRQEALRDFQALGASVNGDVLQDVEGNEFTVVERDDVAERQLTSVEFHCLDTARMLEFWSQATGYRVSGSRCDPVDDGLTFGDGAFQYRGCRYLHVTGMGAAPDSSRLFDLSPGLSFVPTDRPKARKNRLHLDLNSTDAGSDRDRLVGLGATVLRWDAEHVLADPEGNEFCLSPAMPAG